MLTRLQTVIRTVRLRFSIIGRLVGFLWRNKLWWMIPMIMILAVFFLIIIFAQSSPLGPFIYTLF